MLSKSLSGFAKLSQFFREHPLSALFAVALIVRLLAGWGMGSVGDDNGERIEQARRLLQGQGLVMYPDGLPPQGPALKSWHLPAFPLMLAANFWLFGETLEPLRLLYCLIGASACLMLATLGKAWLGPKGSAADGHAVHAQGNAGGLPVAAQGTIAGWLLALYPGHIFWSSRVNPFSLLHSLIVIALWLLWRHRQQPAWPKMAGLGLLWAFCSLMRGEYFFGCACIILCLAVKNTNRVKDVAIFVLFLTLGMAPWVWRNWKIHNGFLLLSSHNADVLWDTFHPDYHFDGNRRYLTEALLRQTKGKTELERSSILLADALHYMNSNPQRTVYIIAGNLLHFWRPYLSMRSEHVSSIQNLVYTLSYLPLFILFLLGLKNFPRQDPLWLFIAAFILYKWLIHAPGYPAAHFREALAPLMILLASRALAGDRANFS